MPTYEYECDKCGGHFEYFQSMSEPRKTVCESCGGRLTKLLSAGSGLIFKGSGFYITDYKTKSGGESSGSGKTESSTSSKSEPSSTPAKSDSGSKSGSSDK